MAQFTKRTIFKLNFLKVIRIKFILLLALTLCAIASFSQTEKEKIQKLEEQRQIDRQRKITVKLDSAIRLSEEGEYEAADNKFKAVLKTIRSVPTDLTFHFGKNSFFLGKYKQSVDWMNKYIQLKGTSGQYSEEAMEWLAKAEVELLKEKEREAKLASEVLSKDFTIDCGPSGKVACTVCRGTTVLIKRTYFGDSYSTCGYCHKLGYLTCEEYNMLLKGELKPEAK
jgi:hypothetical protein